MKKGLSKRTIKVLVTIAAAVTAAVIGIHHNPLADQHEENIKKIIACLMIMGAVGIFYRFYDKLVSLPVELWQSRQLIWKLAKTILRTATQALILGASGRLPSLL